MSWSYLPGRGAFHPPSIDSQIKAAGRWYRLLTQFLAVLKAHPGENGVEKEIARVQDSLDHVIAAFRPRMRELERTAESLGRDGKTRKLASTRALIGRYIAELPPLGSTPADPSLRVHVRMLLAAKDWPLPWSWREEGWPYAIMQCRDGLVWIVVTDNNTGKLGLAGLKPEGEGPAAVWQAEGIRGGLNWLRGLVLGDDHSYVACDNVPGIVEFPGTAARGQGAIKKLRVLGPADGLPAGRVTAIAGSPQQMWVGFGGVGRESGLGLYNAATCAWRTSFSNTEKGDTALTSGHGYWVYPLVPRSDGVFFNTTTGFWRLDPASGEVSLLGRGVGRLGDCVRRTTDGFCIHDTGMILHVDVQHHALRLDAGDSWAASQGSSLVLPWHRDTGGFSPVAPDLVVRPWMYGGVDMQTAAIRGDCLWARCGRTQIAILKRGQKVEEARKIENNILDGGPVLQFFDTPYGLLAVGEGSVGIIEDGAAE